MTSILIQAGIGQCLKYYTIPDEELPTESAPEKDFFVGRKRIASVQIGNGSTLHTRDIVVLGVLSVQAKDVENTALPGKLIARYVINAAKCSMKNLDITCKGVYIAKNVNAFTKELEDILSDWFLFQKESAEKMGLKSILV